MAAQEALIARQVEIAVALGARLRAAGVEMRESDRRGDGSDFVFCRDFDGNTVELTHHRSWRDHTIVGHG